MSWSRDPAPPSIDHREREVADGCPDRVQDHVIDICRMTGEDKLQTFDRNRGRCRDREHHPQTTTRPHREGKQETEGDEERNIADHLSGLRTFQAVRQLGPDRSEREKRDVAEMSLRAPEIRVDRYGEDGSAV